MGKVLRVIAIIMMGLTAAFTLLGGIGTICVAWFPENYDFEVLVPYKSIYQTATIFTLAAAMLGIAATVALIRGKKWAYRGVLIALLVGLATAGTKMYYSSMLRGSVAPTNIRFNMTIVTLIVFLLLRIPGIWQKVDLTRSGKNGSSNNNIAAGAAMILSGLVTLTTPIWVGSTHMLNGYNLVHVLDVPLTIGGATLVTAGILSLLRTHATAGTPATTSRAKEARLPRNAA